MCIQLAHSSSISIQRRTRPWFGQNLRRKLGNMLLLWWAPGKSYRGSQGLVKRAFRVGGPESAQETTLLFSWCSWQSAMGDMLTACRRPCEWRAVRYEKVFHSSSLLEPGSAGATSISSSPGTENKANYCNEQRHFSQFVPAYVSPANLMQLQR